MEAWSELWSGAVAFAGIVAVLGVIVAALTKLHKMVNRFKMAEKMANENTQRIEANRQRYAANAEMLRKMTQTMLVATRTNIYNLCNEARQKGYCSQERRKLINDLNTDYKENGGNGDVKDIVQKTFALPLGTESEEENE